MPMRRTSITRPAAPLALATACLVASLTWASAGCQGGAALGESCDTLSDCADELQCLGGVCVPRCRRHTDCGDGHTCREDGVCQVVDSALGALCGREMDCGPGQACRLLDADIDGDGWLTAECAPEKPGGVLDSGCLVDDDCRTGTCALGRCVDLCADDDDCSISHRCTMIPRPLPTELVAGPLPWASFHGCLQARGNLRYPIPMDEEFQRFLLPVPGRARSVALTATINGPAQLVGVTYIESPSGEVLYALPPAPDSPEYFANRIRHYPAPVISTVILPQSPDDPLVPGAYVVDVGSFLALPSPLGTEKPVLEAVYKMDDLATLDLHFYFLNLADDHPCRSAFGPDETLDAASASASGSPFRQEYLAGINLAFARAGVVIGTSTFTDVVGRQDLDGLDTRRLGELLSTSSQEGGLAIFFVRTLSPSGLQALVGGPPAPPGRPGTRASGVAIGADSLCYRSWSELARTTAHEMARAMGLQRSVEPTGENDAIADTGTGSDNLMFFGEGGGTDLTDSQRAILRNSAVLR